MNLPTLPSQNVDFGERLAEERDSLLYNAQRDLSPEDAEDFVQDVIAQALKQKLSFEFSGEQLNVWLKKLGRPILDRFFLEQQQRVKRHSIDLIETVQDSHRPLNGSVRPWALRLLNRFSTHDDAATASVDDADFFTRVQRAMEKLPQTSQQIFAYLIEGHTRRQIAEMMSITTSAVGSRLHRARKMMRGIFLNPAGRKAWRRDEPSVFSSP